MRRARTALYRRAARVNLGTILQLRLAVRVVDEAPLEATIAVVVEFRIRGQAGAEEHPFDDAATTRKVVVGARRDAVDEVHDLLGPLVAVGVELAARGLPILDFSVPFEAPIEIVIGFIADFVAAHIERPTRIGPAVVVAVIDRVRER